MEGFGFIGFRDSGLKKGLGVRVWRSDVRTPPTCLTARQASDVEVGRKELVAHAVSGLMLHRHRFQE